MESEVRAMRSAIILVLRSLFLLARLPWPLLSIVCVLHCVANEPILAEQREAIRRHSPPSGSLVGGGRGLIWPGAWSASRLDGIRLQHVAIACIGLYTCGMYDDPRFWSLRRRISSLLLGAGPRS